MPDRENVIYDIERCICHVPDACRDCSHYGHGEVIGCMEELLTDALELLKEQEAVVRCKDCKHGEPCKNGFGEDAIECFDSDICLEVRCRRPNWFCADGERR